MKDRLEKIKSKTINAVSTSRLEQRINLKRFQDLKPLNKKVEKKDDERRFVVSDFNQVKSEKTNKTYLVKTSLNSGALKKGDVVIGAVKNGQAVVFGHPAGDPFLSQEKEKLLTEKFVFSVGVEITFR